MSYVQTFTFCFYVAVETLGCFANSGGSPRPFRQFANLRVNIDWNNIDKTVEECGNITLSRGFQVSNNNTYSIAENVSIQHLYTAFCFLEYDRVLLIIISKKVRGIFRIQSNIYDGAFLQNFFPQKALHYTCLTEC